MKDFWVLHPEKLEQAKALWAEGHSAGEIASEIGGGVSRNAVLGKLCRLGLCAKKLQPDGTPRPKIARAKPAKPRMALVHAPSVPVDEPPALTLDGAPITILNAGPNHCRWPHGDPLKDDFHFCGHPKAEGRPYCAYHCSVAYVVAQVSPRGRKAAGEPQEVPATSGEAA